MPRIYPAHHPASAVSNFNHNRLAACGQSRPSSGGKHPQVSDLLARLCAVTAAVWHRVTHASPPTHDVDDNPQSSTANNAAPPHITPSAHHVTPQPLRSSAAKGAAPPHITHLPHITPSAHHVTPQPLR
eukprot:363692-Chlamydomonas_euryale.AAC.14